MLSPAEISIDEILKRAVTLNAKGRDEDEEQKGLIRWLRADFQKRTPLAPSEAATPEAGPGPAPAMAEGGQPVRLT